MLILLKDNKKEIVVYEMFYVFIIWNVELLEEVI